MLTTLGLRRCGLSPEGLCEVCNAVRMNTTMTYIDLSENRFDDKSMTCLGKWLIILKITSSGICRTVIALTLAQYLVIIICIFIYSILSSLHVNVPHYLLALRQDVV